jgi:hypothetical protein
VKSSWPAFAQAPASQPFARHRVRLALAAAAAGAALVGGTVAVTNAFDHPSSTRMATEPPQPNGLRTGTFVGPGHRVLGQIVAYRGHPSWVFMNLTVPHYDGPITCQLQAADGSVVSYGTFHMNNGVGQFTAKLGIAVKALRGARLVTATGSPVASATFA